MSNSAKKVWRILGIIASVFLSIILVISLTVTPIISSALSILKPSVIADIVRDTDVIALITGESATTPDSQSIEQRLTVAIIQSDFAKELLEMYLGDVLDIINGKAEAISITPEIVTQLSDKHMDNLVETIRGAVPELKKMSDDMLRQQLSALNKNVLTVLPDTTSITEMAATIQSNPLTAMLFNPILPWIMYGCIILLAVIIFFCLYGRARGFLCLGIDALIAGIPLIVAFILLSNTTLILSLLKAPATLSALASPILGAVCSNLLLTTILIIVIGILCIATYIIYTIYRKKKANKALPAETTADEIPVNAE